MIRPQPRHAGVAELVDALDSKSSSGNRVGVRVSPPAPSPVKIYSFGNQMNETSERKTSFDWKRGIVAGLISGIILFVLIQPLSIFV